MPKSPIWKRSGNRVLSKIYAIIFGKYGKPTTGI